MIECTRSDVTRRAIKEDSESDESKHDLPRTLGRANLMSQMSSCQKEGKAALRIPVEKEYV